MGKVAATIADELCQEESGLRLGSFNWEEILSGNIPKAFNFSKVADNPREARPIANRFIR